MCRQWARQNARSIAACATLPIFRVDGRISELRCNLSRQSRTRKRAIPKVWPPGGIALLKETAEATREGGHCLYGDHISCATLCQANQRPHALLRVAVAVQGANYYHEQSTGPAGRYTRHEQENGLDGGQTHARAARQVAPAGQAARVA